MDTHMFLCITNSILLNSIIILSSYCFVFQESRYSKQLYIILNPPTFPMNLNILVVRNNMQPCIENTHVRLINFDDPKYLYISIFSSSDGYNFSCCVFVYVVVSLFGRETRKFLKETRRIDISRTPHYCLRFMSAFTSQTALQAFGNGPEQQPTVHIPPSKCQCPFYTFTGNRKSGIYWTVK